MQGTILGLRYRVIEYIAKGGFGKTFLAEDTQLPGKDKCVVKQLFPSVDDPNFIKVARRLFKTEAETLNTLGVHNQIPRLMAYFEEDEKFYLVQQYIEGQTLSNELVSGQTWSEDKVVDLLQDCLCILDFIHKKNVIHRDVKPDNLIRRQSDNKLVLVDFGTVKTVIAEQTQLVPATVAVGTRGYMPTEQARGKPRTTSDIYALGVIAIQALTGIHPTQLLEDDTGEIVWRDKAQCSPQLQDIVAKMTRYHFKDRYQSAEEAIAALNNLQGKSQVSSPAAQSRIEYTPTVQLSDSQLAQMSQRMEPTAVEASALASDRSIIATPQNLTNFSAEPLSGIAENALHHQSEIQSQPAISEDNDMPNTPKSQKTLVTLGSALAIGAIATGGMHFLNYRSTQSAQESIAQQVANFQAMVDQEDYKTCYEEALTLDAGEDESAAARQMPPKQQQQFQARCGLGVARSQANDLKYDEALAIATTLPKVDPIDEEIQADIADWSSELLDKANQLYAREGDLEQAIEIVNQIPDNSSVKPEVIDAKEFWKAENQAHKSVIVTAEKALSEEKWLYAKQQATKVRDSSESEYWQERAEGIVAQAEEALAETAPQPEAEKPVAPAVNNSTVNKPAVTPPSKPQPSPSVPKTNISKPEPKPTPRVNQDSGGSLRDLGGSSAPKNNAPLRDL